MEATNTGRHKTTAYQADVNCVVKKDTKGIFVEEMCVVQPGFDTQSSRKF